MANRHSTTFTKSFLIFPRGFVIDVLLYTDKKVANPQILGPATFLITKQFFGAYRYPMGFTGVPFFLTEKSR